jgi:hypothetical protein
MFVEAPTPTHTPLNKPYVFASNIKKAANIVVISSRTRNNLHFYQL